MGSLALRKTCRRRAWAQIEQHAPSHRAHASSPQLAQTSSRLGIPRGHSAERGCSCEAAREPPDRAQAVPHAHDTLRLGPLVHSCARA